MINFEQRASDSPFIEHVWRSSSEAEIPFTSTASIYWGMVVTHYEGQIALTVRGPETFATLACCPIHGDWDFFGIAFKFGTFMPHLPPKNVADRNDLVLPEATSQKFWLYGSSWQFPNFDNVESFVNRLIREEILVCDPVVTATIQGHEQELSLRSVQVRFARATGLTHGMVRQIERAQQAAELLRQGVSILDTVYATGYFDQPHLTRSLKRFFGQTPTQIAQPE